MKTVNFLKQAMALGLAALMAVSCGKEQPDSGIIHDPEKEEPENPKDPDDPKDPEDAPTYTIELERESEFDQVDFPESAKE